MKKIKILLAEDDYTLGKIVTESLEKLGYHVVYVEDGNKAIAALHEDIDLYLLDVMMPISDGWMVLRKIKKYFPHKPVILLTAKTQTKDVIKGFELGANDYVRKPFSLEELNFRIKELLQRKSNNLSKHFLGKYQFDYNRQELIFNNEDTMKLSHKETELLMHFLLHKNELLDKVYIMRELWGDDNFFNNRSLDVYVTKLRKKLARDPNLEIVNVRGLGYKLLVKTNG